MLEVTVQVTLKYPDPDQPPNLEQIEQTVEMMLINSMDSGVFPGCSQIEAEVVE